MGRERARSPLRSDAPANRGAARRSRAQRRRDRGAVLGQPSRRPPPPPSAPRARARAGPPRGTAAHLLARPHAADRARRLARPLPHVLGEPPRRTRHADQARPPRAKGGLMTTQTLGTIERD